MVGLLRKNGIFIEKRVRLLFFIYYTINKESERLQQGGEKVEPEDAKNGI